MLLIMILFALFGSTFVFGEAAVRYVQPVFFVMIRMFIAGFLMLGYQFFKDRPSLSIKKKDWLMLFQTSFFLLFFAYVIEFWVLQYVTGAKVSLLWNLSPFITAIFAYYFFNEKMTGKKILGLVIGFLGFIPILIAPAQREHLIHKMFSLSWAETILIIAVIAAAYGWIVFKRVMDRGYQPTVINGYAMVISGFLSLLLSLVSESWTPFPVSNWAMAGWYIFYLTLVGNIICFNLYGYLLNRYSTTYLSFCGFMTPMFAAIIQYFYFGNPVGIPFILSLILVSIGLYIFYQEELRQGYIKE
ncbi:MAG TPA: DMT family transporter [Candidatus Babeliales bacterium]|nr:DMT family transporter [Candidatus Babeliales bacterium]